MRSASARRVVPAACFLVLGGALVAPAAQAGSNAPLIGVGGVRVLPSDAPTVSATVQWNDDLGSPTAVVAAEADGRWRVVASQAGAPTGNGKEKLVLSLDADGATALAQADEAVLSLSQQGAGGGAVRVVPLTGALGDGAVGELGHWGCASRPITAGADLGGCDLSAASLQGADLTGISLAGGQLPALDLRDTTIDGADFSDANLNGADLSTTPGVARETAVAATASFAAAAVACPSDPADFSRAALEWAQMSYGDFTCANFTQASLFFAELSGANLSGANLTDANLEFAELYGANLTGANLTGAYLPDFGTCWDSTTIWPEGFTPPEPC